MTMRLHFVTAHLERSPWRGLCVAVLTAVWLCVGAACSDPSAAGVDAGDAGDAGDVSDADAGDTGDAGDVSDADAVTDGSLLPDGGPLPDGIPVPLSSVIEDGSRDRIVITFDRSIAKTGDTGFTIRGGDALTVTSVTLSGAVLTLHLSAEARYLQNAITWSYDEATGGITHLRDLRLIHAESRILAPPMTGTEYFVSDSGSAGNIGLTEASPWTMAHAVAAAQPGDKVWVKAGSYGAPDLDFTTSGSATDRIVFEGYKESVGGVPVPVTDLYYDYNSGGLLDPSELPLFDGGDETGVGFNIRGLEHVTFRNLTLTRYQIGIHGGWQNSDSSDAVRSCLFERIAVTRVGGSGDGGTFIMLFQQDSEYNTMRDCRGQDSSMTGFSINGRGNFLQDCRSYSERDNSSGGEAQDYYYAIRGVENVAWGNLAHRLVDTAHNGHGFALRGETPDITQYNLVQEGTVINIVGAYELRNEMSAYNVIRDCVSETDGAINGEGTAGIKIIGGSHHNLVEGFSARGVSIGISFAKGYEAIVDSCGHDNLIRNSEFYGMPQYEGSGGYSLKHAILGSTNGPQNSPEITDNRIVNCTFHDFSYFLRLYPETGSNGVTASGNRIINCSISTGLYFKHPDTI
ncbi:MAG: hypothetical protein KAI66_22455, partial [Lentisphaeria bacterium]|nr:hypothetical protein [Lentisphaeria bacterium]